MAVTTEGKNGEQELAKTMSVDEMAKEIERLRNENHIKDLENQILVLKTQTTPAAQKSSRIGGRHESKPVLDTKTNIVYKTEASAGKAVASEYGLSLTTKDGKVNNFVWFQIPDKDTRFKHITMDEFLKLSKPAETVTETK
jgi:hypothetical protein